MTADVVNLRRARKERARADQERRAAGNRAAFGVPKAEREASRAREGQSNARLDGHRREGGSQDAADDPRDGG